MISAKVVSISRLRIGTDGTGVRSLVLLHGCPLRCQYCINPHTWGQRKFQRLTPLSLYQLLAVDDLYFQTTGGGVTFGGGEPTLYSAFIAEFVRNYAANWSINLETSLQTSEQNLQLLIPVTDTFIVDIKSMNPAVYTAYTGKSSKQMLTNLSILENECPEKVLIRIPLIPGFNTAEDCAKTEKEMHKRGFLTDSFSYIPRTWKK